MKTEDPTERIIQAVNRGASAEEVASVYADAILEVARTQPRRLGLGDVGFIRANTAIFDRFGNGPHFQIRDRAWEIVDERERQG